VLAVVVAAMAGATTGFVVRQMVDARRDPRPPEERRPLIVAAPLTNTVIAVLVGLLSGRSGPATAFASGLLTTSTAGNLDEVIPGLGTLRRDQLERIFRNARSGPQQS
jgi:hypothetical protein